MAEHILATDTLNAGRIKINELAIDAAARAETNSETAIAKGDQAIQKATELGNESIQIATDKGNESIEIAETTGAEAIRIANEKGDSSISIATTKGNESIAIAENALEVANGVRNEFDQIIQEAGDSNPEIVNARTDQKGVKHDTLNARLTSDLSRKVEFTDLATTSKDGLMSKADKSKLTNLPVITFTERGEVVD
ncbi:hypothetical protein [Enterococcus sp. 5H]|uniref:hypothetical protein n=1 Tax=Enterococcus sp. 5H TaxID=1229490 RepID=UPI0023044015|nr:hypothetical protein [Enterococcus sp. 5H]MDA9472638.1 hypothetical protein [Enterococcus sp. 5H]